MYPGTHKLLATAGFSLTLAGCAGAPAPTAATTASPSVFAFESATQAASPAEPVSSEAQPAASETVSAPRPATTQVEPGDEAARARCVAQREAMERARAANPKTAGNTKAPGYDAAACARLLDQGSSV